MPFPSELTHAIDGVTEIIAAHLNNLEAKVGVDGSPVPTSLDYLLKSGASLNPGHKHSRLWAADGDPEAVTVDAAGQVGVGTTSPGDKLHLHQPANVGDLYLKMENPAPGNNLTGIKLQNDTGDLACIGLFASGSLAYPANSLLIQNRTPGPIIFGHDWLTEDMRITHEGNVGVGCAPLADHRLQIKGANTSGSAYGLMIQDAADVTNMCVRNDGTGYLRAASWEYGSDARLKTNVRTIEESLPVICQLNPVRFDYLEGESNQAGFIAQDIQPILPDLVSAGEGGMLGLRITSLVPYLVKAVQELAHEVAALKENPR